MPPEAEVFLLLFFTDAIFDFNLPTFNSVIILSKVIYPLNQR